MDCSDLTVLTASPSCVGGGAERVALTLHQEYLARGIDSWLAVANRNCDEPRAVDIPVDSGRSPWAGTILKGAAAVSQRDGRAAWFASRALRAAAEPLRYARVLRGHEDFNFPATHGLLDLIPSPADVLHLHNLHGAWFDVRALPALSARVPTMITLHDAWLLTGHCAYPLDCDRWKTGCGECPYLDLYVAIRGDESAANARIKRESVARSRLALACPSQWLLNMVVESGLMSNTVQARVVPNGIDTRIFHPSDKARAREKLGLPQDATILCFAGRGLEGSQFKGYGTLRSALAKLAEDGRIGHNVLLLALGADSLETSVGGIRIQPVPFVAEPEDVALHYQASDLYVHPARAETFGLAVAEAMACGTPVIAAAVGGIPEIVVDGTSGVLFPHDNAASLSNALEALLSDDDRRARLGAAGAERISERFSLEKQVATYLDWYAELLEEARHK